MDKLVFQNWIRRRFARGEFRSQESLERSLHCATIFSVLCLAPIITGGCAEANRKDVPLDAQQLRAQLEQLTRQTKELELKLQALENPQRSFVQHDEIGQPAIRQQGLDACKEKWLTRIPTHWNDGVPIPAEKLAAILRRIADEFGGASLDGPGRGIWIGDDGALYEETSYTLSVACESDDLPRARELVNWIGRELQQRSMYFEVQDSPVQVIPVAK